MTMKKAIMHANALRPNTLDDEIKANWVHELDAKIAEMMGEDEPVNYWPEDSELLMSAPCDNIYELYVMAMIDYYNQETTLYANDMAVYGEALAEARASWRRAHKPVQSKNYTMPC